MPVYSTLEDAAIELTELLRPPERITVAEAAEKYVKLNNAGAYIGPYRNAVSPYMVEPMNTLQSLLCSTAIFVGPAQCGKTEALLLNWIAYSVMVDGMDMLVFSPTQSASRDFSIRRLDRMHRNSPEIGEKLLPSRDADNVFDKQYRSGMFLNLGHPTVAQFAGRPVGRIALTDYDRMPEDIGGDGSPFDLASKRTTTFRSYAMTIAESSPSRPVENPRWIAKTPHEAPPCTGILGLYNRGDRRRWYWPCPHCLGYFEGKWDHIEWDEKSSILATAETARLRCPLAGCRIEQRSRAGMQEWGIWLKDGQTINSDTGVIEGEAFRSSTASFWLNGVAAAFTNWTNLVNTYLNALGEFERTGTEEALKKFFNTDLGMPYLPKSMESELLPEILRGRAEDLPTTEQPVEERIDRMPMTQPFVPLDVRFLIATVDVQNNLFVVQVQGILPGAPFDMVVIDRFQIRKSDRQDNQGDYLWVKPNSHLEDWDQITREVIDRTYPLADGTGRRMGIRLTGCDSGGREGVTTNAYNYQRKLRAEGKSGKFHLIRGDHLASRPRAQVLFPDSNRKDKLSAARGDVPIMFLNSNMLKDALRGRLDVTEPGKGMLRFPLWLPDAWFAEMCSEVRTDKGWENPRNLRNEAWDCTYYALGLCVSPIIRVENIDWANPPVWAATWDTNTFVSVVDKPVEKRFAQTEKEPAQQFDFASLAAKLG